MGSKKRKETHKKEKEESKKATKDFKNTEGEKGGRSGKNNVKPVEAAPRVRADPDTDQRSEFTIITACGTLIWVVYLYTLHPSLPGGDSGELIVAAHELGVPHPPGYPLFTMISKLAISLLPVGNVAYRAHILNASVAAAAAVLLQLTVFRLTRSHPAAILSAGLFALSPLTWSWATTAEVFSLNNFFIALLMLLSVQFEQSPVQLKPKVAVVGAFVCGLSLCNQHTIAVYVMLIVFWVMYSLASYKLLSLILCVKLGVGFLLGLLPYIYLPLSAYWNTARYTWGDQRTWGGFVRHLLRQEYGTFDLGKDQVGSDMYTFLSFYLDHTITSFLYIGPTLALVGIVVSFKRAWKNEGGSVLTFFLMSLCYTLFFAWRANLNLANPLFKGVVERFWLQTDVVLAVLAGVGFNTITSYLSSKLPPMNTVSTSGAFIISIAVALTQLQVNFHQCNQSGNHVVHDFALNVLSSFPQNSVIFLKGDLPSISIRYFHLCENVRPDINIIDQEILSYEWSLAMTRKFHTIAFPGSFWSLKNEHLPDGGISFNFKHLIQANYDRFPLFVCIGMQDRDPSWSSSYDLWPYGVCSKIVKKGTKFIPHKWGLETQDITSNWSYPYDGFPETSWEVVATHESWQAKISSAFYMYDKATKTSNKDLKTSLFVESHRLYKKAIKDNGSIFPSYWHKNFALVCEKLLRLDNHPLDKASLLEETITHFTLYLEKKPDDPQAESIRAAVKTLQKST